MRNYKKLFTVSFILLLSVFLTACLDPYSYKLSNQELELRVFDLESKLIDLEMSYDELLDERNKLESEYLHLDNINYELQNEISRLNDYISELECSVRYYEEIECRCAYLYSCDFCDEKAYMDALFIYVDYAYCANCLYEAMSN